MFRVSWNAPSSGGTPTWYNIWRATSASGTYTEIGYVNGSTTSYTNTGLSASTAYYYKVDAENSAGKSPQSSYVSTTTSSSGGGTSAPSAPTGVTATAQSPTSIRISWNSVSGATSYRVYYGIASYSTFTQLLGTTTTTSITDTDPYPGETWYYKVSAVNSAGESVLSSYVYATTPSILGR
jgi:fibronectin type 3 domain-containing protein